VVEGRGRRAPDQAVGVTVVLVVDRDVVVGPPVLDAVGAAAAPDPGAAGAVTVNATVTGVLLQVCVGGPDLRQPALSPRQVPGRVTAPTVRAECRG